MAVPCEVLVLGIGNLLWADEGFGVRAVEALHAAFAFPAAVALKDGGTLGLNLYEDVASARRVLVLDAVDFGLAPGSLVVLRGDDVPAWGRTRLSPHQLGFNDVLALAQLNGRAPETVVAIGVQPVELSDFGGSLRPAVRDRIPEAVALAAAELATWGYPGVPRAPDAVGEPLNATVLALSEYEAGRPDALAARRDGDPRVLARTETN
ncbi:MAG: HyaD/HybD family hydrogenase maturation endopeptidase [Betaproteobacteria bacterium]|nr:HyaD/HybD family hydrogenase maturation endopeptidase [Betaproteobacteria bacterium]